MGLAGAKLLFINCVNPEKIFGCHLAWALAGLKSRLPCPNLTRPWQIPTFRPWQHPGPDGGRGCGGDGRWPRPRPCWGLASCAEQRAKPNLASSRGPAGNQGRNSANGCPAGSCTSHRGAALDALGGAGPHPATKPCHVGSSAASGHTNGPASANTKGQPKGVRQAASGGGCGAPKARAHPGGPAGGQVASNLPACIQGIATLGSEGAKRIAWGGEVHALTRKAAGHHAGWRVALCLYKVGARVVAQAQACTVQGPGRRLKAAAKAHIWKQGGVHLLGTVQRLGVGAVLPLAPVGLRHHHVTGEGAGGLGASAKGARPDHLPGQQAKHAGPQLWRRAPVVGKLLHGANHLAPVARDLLFCHGHRPVWLRWAWKAPPGTW